MTSWPTSPAELIHAQNALAATVADRDATKTWRAGDPTATTTAAPHPHPAIGAAVVIFPRGQTGRGARGDPAWAAAAVLRRRQVLAEATVRGEAAGPYIPGMLALREGRCLEAAVRALAVAPDVLLVDATGANHPRHAGLALHLGAILGLPTVGVTHRPLLAHGDWPDDIRGAHSWLSLDGSRVGAWVRTRTGARPVAVHAGWRTTLEVAIEIVLTCSPSHRTPEPFRRARQLARVARARR